MTVREIDRYITNPGPKTPVHGLRSACSSDSAIVTETMLKILADGGNAADACIAGAMVQAATEPHMTNHTGSVTFLYFEAKSRTYHQLDSTGTFPAGLRPFKPVPTMPNAYARLQPSACIPGFMPGMKAIHERFGTRPWSVLCEDAIRWADEGHPVSSFEYGFNVWGQDFTAYFPSGRKFYMPDGFLVPVGERFRFPEMAETLRWVAEVGPDYMISGGWAKRFVETANDMGWPIKMEHMAATPPRWIEPLRFQHHEYEIVGLAPPQQQAVFCAITLGILSHLSIRDMVMGSAEHIFSMAHALRYASYHCGFLGDPEMCNYDIEALLSPDLHETAANLIRGLIPKIDLSNHTLLTRSAGDLNVKPGTGEPSGVSSHSDQPSGSCELSIVDADGNWVQMMNTLQSGGIPGVVLNGIPMFGSHATFSGVSGGIDVKLAPGARMRCVMGNTFVLKDGRPIVSLGTPGNVYCTVPQVLTNLLDFNLDPYSAIDVPRILPMAEDGSLTAEDRLSATTKESLARMGVRLRAVPGYDYHMGSFQMCYKDTNSGLTSAVADPRRCGVADGLK